MLEPISGDPTEMLEQLNALVSIAHGNLYHRLSALSNACALLAGALDRINWVGFYLVGTDQTLMLGPFQGAVACTEIPHGKGVCGTAWARGETLVVPDVHAFAGHIACDAASRSEVVVPLFVDGRVVGVLDVDSPETGRFSLDDVDFLQKAAGLVSRILPLT